MTSIESSSRTRNCNREIPDPEFLGVRTAAFSIEDIQLKMNGWIIFS